MTITTPVASSLLDIRNLKASFFTRRGVVKAVDGVSFKLGPGEVLGLVGESGCGKSVTALSVLRSLQIPGRIVDGEIFFEGNDLVKMSERDLRQIRGRRIAMVPQDPLTALNPVLKVGDHIREVLEFHMGLRGRAATTRGIELLERVGIPSAAERFEAYPHQLSGGMRQRVLIALAIACEPALLIADEPTTALDATIQAQILELLADLTQASRMALLLITHNLGIVASHCHRVAVMYAGLIMEMAPVDQLFAAPQHRYTSGLLDCVPRLDRQGKGVFYTIPGSPPDPTDLPTGCPFHPRCAFKTPNCVSDRPPLTLTPHGDSLDLSERAAVACWNPRKPGETPTPQ